MPKPSNMLSADELEALRADLRDGRSRSAGVWGRPFTPEELDRRRSGDEWWTERLRQMREQEATKSDG